MLGKNLKEKTAVFVATWGYSGLIPPVFFKGMAGTYGSIFSIPLCYWVIYLAQNTVGLGGLHNGISGVYIMFLIYVYIFGILVIPLAEKVIGRRKDWHGIVKTRDQNQIVIDETFGVLITCYPIILMQIDLFSWSGAILIFLAFLYFRLFDIVKVYPTKIFDRMKSSFGVMADDAMAGIYAAHLLYFTYWLFFL